VSLSAFLIALIYSVQVFNNNYLHIAGPLTLGELLSLILFATLLIALISRPLESVPFSGKFAVAAFSVYWLCALGAVAISPVPAISMNFLATVTFQLMLFSSILFFLRPNDVFRILKLLGLFAAILGLINFWNSVPGVVDFFQSRQNQSRGLVGIRLPIQRVVSFTNIYGQLGGLLVFGFFILCGCSLWQQKGIFNVRRFGHLVLLFFVFLGIVALQSRATLLGFSAGLLVFLFFMSGHWLRLFSFLLSALIIVIFWKPLLGLLENTYQVIVGLQSSTVNTRLSGYMDALELIGKHPLGVGQGSFGVVTDNRAVLHQTFLDAFVSTGWMGGIALCAAVLTPVAALLPSAMSRNTLAAGFLAGYASIFCVLNFYTGLTEYFFWLLIPLGIALGRFLDRQSLRNETA
jgi:O-antigen ligase